MGTVVNSAAGALQQHILMQQIKAAQARTDAESTNTAPPNDSADPYAGIVFSGNPHETVPRRLLLDDRLSPTERNAWQVFRLLIHTDGVTAFPTYEQLRPYLGSIPGKAASRETIAKTLTLLRLTRWLSLGRRVRDAVSGRMQGNVYILHDEPIGCAEAMEIDHDYMLLIGQSLEHANKSVRLLAERALNEVAGDTYLHGSALPSRLDVLAERLEDQSRPLESHTPPARMTEFGIRTQEMTVSRTLISDSELSENKTGSTSDSQSSESELRQKMAELVRVRHPNSYSTYTNTNASVSKSFVQYPADPALLLPESLIRLSDVQRQQAMLAIDRVKPDIRQSVLNQWHHRVTSGGIKSPLAYLLSCVQRAVKGEFNAQWQAPSLPTQETVASAPAVSAAKLPDYNTAMTATRVPDPPPISTPLVRDEVTVDRGRQQMLSIRQELGLTKRRGSEGP